MIINRALVLNALEQLYLTNERGKGYDDYNRPIQTNTKRSKKIWINLVTWLSHELRYLETLSFNALNLLVKSFFSPVTYFFHHA